MHFRSHIRKNEHCPKYPVIHILYFRTERAIAVGTILACVAAITSIASAVSGIINDIENTKAIKQLNNYNSENLIKHKKLFLSQSNLNFLLFDEVSRVLHSSYRELSRTIEEFNSQNYLCYFNTEEHSNGTF